MKQRIFTEATLTCPRHNKEEAGTIMKNRIKEMLAAGKPVMGTFITLNSPDLVEIAGIAGFDFVIIDAEHGPMDPESLQNLLRGAELRGATPVVRIPETSDTWILKTLDVGAQGIQLPQVNSAEQAARIVRGAKYFPLGNRGVALPRSSSYGLIPLDRAFEEANRETLIVTHCENVLGLKALPEIAAVEGVDVLFVGPYDLSQSLGIPGQIDHPDMKSAIAQVLSVARNAGKPTGIFVTSPEEALRRLDEGFLYIAWSVDGLIFGDACRTALRIMRGNRA